VDHLPLWGHFLAGVSREEVRCYVHAKTAKPEQVLEHTWIDPDPLPTAWGCLSLVLASRRLFEQAWGDGCTAMVLLSGDMLPLKSFQEIRQICLETQLSLQPRTGLKQQQQEANQRRFEEIAPWFGLRQSVLRKQNMFFAVTAADYALLRQFDPSTFPLDRLADEYFWVNCLIRSGLTVRDSRFVFCNSDLTRTQATSFHLDETLTTQCSEGGYCFIRKVASVSRWADVRLRNVYAGGC